MKINQKYNGTIIGGIFTLGSLLLALTIIVPIITIIPGAYIESFVASFIDNAPYSKVGKFTLLTVFLLFLLVLSFILFSVRKVVYSNSQIFGTMTLLYFPVHILGFYLHWAGSMGFKNDGQLIFGVADSFPISSFRFVCLGVLIDWVKINPQTS